MGSSLLEFCTTEKQYNAVKLCLVDGMTQSEAAEKMGVTRNAVKNLLVAVKQKAQVRGFSPKHDWFNPVPDGHKIKGVSTFYDEDGKPVRQWVKSQTDEKRQFDILVDGD